MSDRLENWQRCHNMKAMRCELGIAWLGPLSGLRGSWDYAQGAHRYFTDNRDSHREWASDRDSGKPQTTIITPRKIFSIKCQRVRERERGTTIGALAVADTLVRLIKMSELHESRVGEGKREGDNKLQKLQTKQRSHAKLFEPCYLWTRVVYVINCLVLLAPRLARLTPVQLGGNPMNLKTLSGPLKFHSIPYSNCGLLVLSAAWISLYTIFLFSLFFLVFPLWQLHFA